MVVGCKDLDFAATKRACKSAETLRAYALDTVPTPLRHIQAIVDNQKYLIALQVRAISSISWQQRKALCEALLEGVFIRGVPDAVYDYNDLLQAIDVSAFERYLREEEEKRNAEG